MRWTRQADRDLDAAFDFIARDDPPAAARTIARIRDASRRLDAVPNLGRAGREAGMRELAVAGTPFVVIYRVGRAAVEVLRVLHGARQWPEPDRDRP